jgi:RNA polymerase sigma factor (sigma-70 family)
MMYATAGKYSANPHQCEDIVQDALIQLARKTALLRGLSPGALTRYIVVTTRNTAILHLRKQHRRGTHVVSFEELHETVTPGIHETLDRHLIIEELKEAMRTIWPQLDEDTRLLLEGRYFLDYDDRELADLLGCQTASVRMKLTRARRQVRSLLKEGEQRDQTREET